MRLEQLHGDIARHEDGRHRQIKGQLRDADALLTAEREEDFPDHGHETDDDERLGGESMGAQGEHDGVNDLHENEHEQDLVEKIGGVERERHVGKLPKEVDDADDEDAGREDDERDTHGSRNGVLGPLHPNGRSFTEPRQTAVVVPPRGREVTLRRLLRLDYPDARPTPQAAARSPANAATRSAN